MDMYNQNSDHFEEAMDPETDVVMGVTLIKESTFLESRFCQRITNAKKVRIFFFNYQLQPKS